MQTPYPFEAGDSEILYQTIHDIADGKMESARTYFNERVSKEKAYEKIVNMAYLFSYNEEDIPRFTTILLN